MRHRHLGVQGEGRGLPAVRLGGLVHVRCGSRRTTSRTTTSSSAGRTTRSVRSRHRGSVPQAPATCSTPPLRSLAVYRDYQGRVATMSAFCPYMKGVVRWNATEKSFDCSEQGFCFMGPAKGNLPPTQGVVGRGRPTGRAVSSSLLCCFVSGLVTLQDGGGRNQAGYCINFVSGGQTLPFRERINSPLILVPSGLYGSY